MRTWQTGGGGVGERRGGVLGGQEAGEAQKARLGAPRRWGQCRAEPNTCHVASSVASSTDPGPLRPWPLSSSKGPQAGVSPGPGPGAAGKLPSAGRRLAFVRPLLSAPLARGPGEAEAPGVLLFSRQPRELMCAVHLSVFHKTHNCVI